MLLTDKFASTLHGYGREAGQASLKAEARSLFGRVTGLLPPSITLKLAKKSIRDYSAACGHDVSYRLDWTS